MSETGKAVFLSYASQDAEAARRICESLRAGGVEVWFDADGGLEHGDEWDAKIRKQIKECVLFIPVISVNTQARHEGYFRLEWELAAQRAMSIASGVPFILPVVIDDTREPDALVPDRFRMVQWTKLLGGVVTPEVQARYLKLWSHRTGALKATELEQGSVRRTEPNEDLASAGRMGSRRHLFAAIVSGVVVAAIAAAVVFWPRAKPSASAPGSPTVSHETAPTAAQLVQKARELLQTPSRARAELELADRFCKQASVLDELSAELWSVWSLVDAWSVYYNFDNSAQRREAARTKAEKAMQLSPNGFEARLAQASFLVLANQHAGALSPFAQKADQLLRDLRREQPRDPEALLAFALLQRNMDRMDAARQALRELAALPRYAAMAYTELGWAEDSVGNLAAASEAASRAVAAEPYWNSLILRTDMALNWEGDVAQAKAMLEQMPTSALQEDYGIYEAMLLAWVQRDAASMLGLVASVPREWMQSNFFEGPTQYFAGVAHLLADRTEAARQSWTRALQTVEKRLADTPDQPETLIWKVRLQAGLGNLPAAQATFRVFKQVATRSVMRGERSFERVADLWLLGEREAALAHLEECVRRNEVTWAQFKTTPTFEPLRSDPRFQALVEQVRQNPRLAPPHAREKKAEGKSVAVLAFANLSDDKENEYFSDGISEELLNVLGRVPGLRVVAPMSAFSFKGKNVSAQEIGQKLNVAYLVNGSVRRAGAEIRVVARLSRADTDEQIWTEKFNGEAKNVFALQDEIAGKIAAALSLKVGASARVAKPIDPEAHRLLLEGRHYWSLRSDEGLARAEELFHKAALLDPQSAQVQEALGDLGAVRALYRGLSGDLFESQIAQGEAAARART